MRYSTCECPAACAPSSCRWASGLFRVGGGVNSGPGTCPPLLVGGASSSRGGRWDCWTEALRGARFRRKCQTRSDPCAVFQFHQPRVTRHRVWRHISVQHSIGVDILVVAVLLIVSPCGPDFYFPDPKVSCRLICVFSSKNCI